MANSGQSFREFEQADAEALPFEADTFDAVANGFGMCHFPNPDVALREAFRVLKRGGRLGFTVWDTPERPVGFGAVYAAVRAHGSMDVALPAGPNFFLFSDPDQLFEVITEGTVRAAATLRAQSPRAREAIRTALRDTVAACKRGEYFEVPMPAAVATAVKP